MTIAEVSKKYGLTADTLRYYERVGLIPKVNRNKNGIRNYTEQDCRNVEFIKCMRRAGLPIEVLIEYVTLLQQGDETVEARRDILIEQRKELLKKMNKTYAEKLAKKEKVQYCEMLMQFNAADKTYGVKQMDVYGSKGTKLETKINNRELIPVPEKTFAEAMLEICLQAVNNTSEN